MSGVKGDPCGNRKARAPRPAYRGAKTAPRAVFRAREIPARAEADVAGVVGVGCCCLRLAERLTEACGPGMPGPYGELKEIGAASGIGIPLALRRHLPLTREAGERRGQDPSLRCKPGKCAMQNE